MDYEYKIVAAPDRGHRRRGLRGGGERLAAAVEEVVAEEATGGWEYLRADVLPSVESAGWFGGRREVNRALLVFRRALDAETAARAGRDAHPAGREAEPARRGEREAARGAEEEPRREPRSGIFGGQRGARGSERVEPRPRLPEPEPAPEAYDDRGEDRSRDARGEHDFSDIREALRRLDR
ncbi:MAG: hypothetical protein ACFBWO_18075 [Paracoccaceae bacterium]